MALSQAMLTRMARTVMRAEGSLVEVVTYVWRSTPDAMPVQYPDLRALITGYQYWQIDTMIIQREDRRLRLPTADVLWVPTPLDTVLRADNSLWQVLTVSGGLAEPFTFFQLRHIG